MGGCSVGPPSRSIDISCSKCDNNFSHYKRNFSLRNGVNYR